MEGVLPVYRLMVIALGLNTVPFVQGATAHGDGPGQTGSTAKRCGQLKVFGGGSWDAVPRGDQRALRRATAGRVRAIMADTGMGVVPRDIWTVPLAAVELTRHAKGRAFYAVSWQEPAFGVNGTVWLVELRAGRAFDRGPVVAAGREFYDYGGFGVAVLGDGKDGLPEVMVASKGFRPEGGPEVDALCYKPAGTRYAAVACPVGCFAALNAR